MEYNSLLYQWDIILKKKHTSFRNCSEHSANRENWLCRTVMVECVLRYTYMPYPLEKLNFFQQNVKYCKTSVLIYEACWPVIWYQSKEKRMGMPNYLEEKINKTNTWIFSFMLNTKLFFFLNGTQLRTSCFDFDLEKQILA